MEKRNLLDSTHIDGWMMRGLHLKGNELLVYAVVYNFSKDGKSEYRGGRHYLAQSLDISFSSVDRAFKNLVSQKLIIKEQFIWKNMVCNNYKADLSKVKQYLTKEEYNPSQNEYPSQNDEGPSQNDDYKININKNKVNTKVFTAGEPAVSKINHNRNFRNSYKAVIDELDSLGEIERKEEEKKAKKKETKKTLYQKCCDSILDGTYNFSSDVQKVLKDYLAILLSNKDIKGVNQWNYRLKALVGLSTDSEMQIKIVEQSIKHGLVGFSALDKIRKPFDKSQYNIQYNNQSNKFETGNVIPTQMTHEEILAEKQRLLDAGAKIY